jgi:cell division protein FtsA
LKYGCAIIDHAEPDQVFKVTRVGSNVEKEFSQVDLANIIEPRMQEIFQLIGAEANRLKKDGFAGGYVLIGGTVAMPGVLEIAQQELNASVRIAVPDYIGVRDPSYTNGVGIIQYVGKHMRGRGAGGGNRKTGNRKAGSASGAKPGFIEKIKNFFKEFI